MIPTKEIPGVHTVGRPAGSWIAELLLASRYFAGLACPLCCRIAAETCGDCRAFLCLEHDVACHVAGDAICEVCWRKHN